jgi:hypothetical protein
MNEQTATQTAPKTAATERMSGQAIIKCFLAEGADTIFGYQGVLCHSMISFIAIKTSSNTY